MTEIVPLEGRQCAEIQHQQAGRHDSDPGRDQYHRIFIIQLPPGDYLESHIATLQAQGESIDSKKIEFLRQQYGLDQPMWKQYLVWATGFLQGDLGYSFEHDMPVKEVIGDRMFLTILISLVTIIFTWLIAFPIGIYSATHQYSWGDYGVTFIGFIGLATRIFFWHWSCCISPMSTSGHRLVA
ncbi:MAG: hypothetical protein Ct9H300mP16_16770 [Pseudomonadota bacterium]|nr:MAG: hypothetical protein Ct9H300mP16_16770 [Pseudomonadota bacterium]